MAAAAMGGVANIFGNGLRLKMKETGVAYL
jgi:hypothetical protein